MYILGHEYMYRYIYVKAYECTYACMYCLLGRSSCGNGRKVGNWEREKKTTEINEISISQDQSSSRENENPILRSCEEVGAEMEI